MNKLYQKSEIWFAAAWIIVYVVGTSIADQLSAAVGIEKCVTFPLHIALSAAALAWLHTNDLFRKYDLCKTDIASSRFLHYIPLVLLSSSNLWSGVTWNLSYVESALYIGSMLCVGFLEELIFRGFLFRAMCKDNVRSAIIVSSLTFGIGHMVNLINGSGADLLSNLCQVCYAVAFGFLFVTICYRGKTMLPCIAAHSAINALSVFADKANITDASRIRTAVILSVIALLYTQILNKTLPQEVEN